MKKMILLCLSLLFGGIICPEMSLAEMGQVEVWIDTKMEDGSKIEGTDKMMFDVYDLTDWREGHGGDEKKDKEFILDTHSTKAKLQSFVKEEELKKCNQTSYTVDGDGSVKFNVARYNRKRDAAYLILPSGETGKKEMVPIILYLPQFYPENREEAEQLLIHGKYQDVVTTPAPKEPPVVESSEPARKLPLTDGSPVKSDSVSSKKNLPSTNDLIRNYLLVGLLLIAVGVIGITRNKKKIKGEKR